MRHLLRYFPILLLLLLLWTLWKGLNIDPRMLPSTRLAHPMPTFTLPNLMHKGSVISNQTLQGKYVLIHFWSPWCITCVTEQPVLLQIAHQKRSASFLFLGISFKETSEKSRLWLKKHGNPYDQIGLDESGEVSIDWGVYGTPETYLVDPNGIVRIRYLGPLTDKIWQERFLPVIQTPVAAQSPAISGPSKNN